MSGIPVARPGERVGRPAQRTTNMEHFNLNEIRSELEDVAASKEALPDFDQELIEYSTVRSCLDKQPKHYTSTIAALVSRLQQHVEREKKDGPAIIPAVFKDGTTRASANVERLTTLVLDIDKGPPYDVLFPKFKPFAHVYHTTHSHTPEHPKYRIIIFLAKPIPVAQWESFWSSAKEYFGHMDEATKDPCRLFYSPAHPPGAEFKTSFNPGMLLTTEHLFPRLAAGAKQPELAAGNAQAPAPREQYDEGNGDLKPAKGLTAVIKKCAFMQHASKPENQGTLREPLWMALITNASGFEDSDDWIHAASEHHDSYDEADTQGRIDRYREKYTPMSCARIRELGFDGCPKGGCKTKGKQVVKAPAGLWGWIKQVPGTPVTNRNEKSIGGDIALVQDNRDIEAEDMLPEVDEHEIRSGDFFIRDSGNYWFETKLQRDGNYISTEYRIASRIDTVALARSADSSEWGACLEFKDRDAVLHSWCVPLSTLSGNNEYCKTLLGMGAYVSPFPRHMQALTEHFLTYDPGPRARAVTKPGWEDNQFIFPDGSHVGHADERISYQTADPTNKAFTQRGTLDSWKENVAKLCAGNSRLVLAIATALTGPVLPLLGEESGGFHFPGESSTGKTTALYPACSVWGKPENFLARWRGTANGIEANATQRNHTMIALDEMSQVSPQEAGEIVYMLANGQGKARATQNATAKAISSWQLMILSTGEVGLEQHMAVAGLKVKAGQQARLIDIQANAGRGLGVFENVHGSVNGAEFSLLLKTRTAEYYGVAGRAWVSALANPEQRPDLLQQIKDHIDEAARHVSPEADGQVRRVARRFALVAAVAEACIGLGILPWVTGHASNEIQRCFDEWVVNRGGLGNLERGQALDRLRRFLVEHGESRFTKMGVEGIGMPSERVTVNRAGFSKLGPDGHTDYYIPATAFWEIIFAGLNSSQVLKHLIEDNALVLNSKGKPQLVMRLPGLGPTRIYHVRSTVFAESEGTDTPPVTQIKMG